MPAPEIVGVPEERTSEAPFSGKTFLALIHDVFADCKPCGAQIALAIGLDRDYTSTLMTRNRAPGIFSSAIWRPLVYLLVAAQVLLAFAPLIEWQFGPDARAHVEAAGTRAHHAHNPADCATCAARGLLGVPNRPAEPSIACLQAASRRLAERDKHLALFRDSQSRPRAPPFRQA
jgi:hypothetical protein